MDITASISDSRSLSQSDLILRSLFSSLQVGSTQRVGRGVTMQGATFRSGTAENPLIVTLKNSQTETVMYVRNIPISMVLERNGLHEQWVAVYPPGDPQNLHFDAVTAPKDGCPAVCISVSIVEDLSSTVITPVPGRGSLPFDPAPRGSVGPGQADQLRRSVDSLQEDLARARQRVDVLGGGGATASTPARSTDSQDRPGGGFPGGYVNSGSVSRAAESRATSRGAGQSSRLSNGSGEYGGSSGDLNNTVQDVNAKAQQIKANLSKMRSASMQAKESTSRLTEQNRIRENLKQQLHSLELQAAELRSAATALRRNVDEARQEEASLLEQIRQKDQAFQELQRSRDVIDQEISRALGEGERQKQSLEASSRDFGHQRRTYASDLDESQAHVASLKEKLHSKEQISAQLEQQMLQEEERQAAEDGAERERLRNMLDQTRSNFSAVRAEAEENERRARKADVALQETSMRISTVEGEMSSLNAAIQDNDDSADAARFSAEAAAALDAKIKAHKDKVARLEAELRENRQKLDGMNENVAELHTEAREMQLAANRCEDERSDLEMRFQVQKNSTADAEEQNRLLQEQLQAAEAELAASEEELRRLENAELEGRKNFEQTSSELASDVERLREEQRQARAQADELQRLCESLEEQAKQKRSAVEERAAEIAAAQRRVEELTRELSVASNEMAEMDDKSKPLRKDLSSTQAQLEAARKRTREKQEEIARLRQESQTDHESSSSRLSALDDTCLARREDLRQLGETAAARVERRRELKGSLAQSEEAVAKLQKEIDALTAAKQDSENEVKQLAQQREAMDAELGSAAAELATLEQAKRDQLSDLEMTKRTAAAKSEEVTVLEAQNRAEIEQMESAAAQLSAAHAEKQGLVAQLCRELEEVKSRCDAESELMASKHREREALGAELESLTQEHSALKQAVEDTLQSTQAGLEEATMRVRRAEEHKDEAASRVQEAEGRRQALGSKAEVFRSEAESEARRTSEVEAELSERRAALEGLRRELEQACEEQAALQARSASAEADLASAQAQVQALEHAHGEVEELERRHAAMLVEERAEEEQHSEALAAREREAADSREELERTRQGLVRKKEEEISRQAMQIGKLEEERRSLLAQAGRLEEEREQLEEGLRARTEARQDVLADTRRKASTCDDLESTVSALKTSSVQLRDKEAEMDQKLSQLRQREEAVREEAQERERRMEQIRSEMDASDRQAAKEVEEHREKMKEHIQAKANHEQELEELKRKLAEVKDEVAALVRDSGLADGRAEEMQDVLSRTKAELQEAVSARDEKRRAVLDQSSKVAPRLSSDDQSPAALEVQRATAMVRELEESLQTLSDRLVEAQEACRFGSAREEELRVDYQAAKERLRGAEDKISYQLEHDKIQTEAIDNMLLHKAKLDEEMNTFVLGLDEKEQHNAALQKANTELQRQVEELYQGSLQEWASQVGQRPDLSPMGGRAKDDDIEGWKHQVQQLSKDKAARMSQLQRQHEEAVHMLRDKVVQAQAELEAASLAVQRRQAALTKRREHGEAVAPAPGGVPGLVVPQRPLPSGHQRRRALLIGVNYPLSHAPLKGCVNDVWNLQCLLRYTLQYREDQMRLLLDCADGRAPRPDRAPTKANILEGLHWLTEDAQPGDNLLLVFCGYGTQHPTMPGSDHYEGYLVPADFAADLPANFFSNANSRGATVQEGAPTMTLDMGLPAFEQSQTIQQTTSGGALTPRDAGDSYRLVSLLEVNEFICRLPKICRMSVVLDCCYGGLPNVSPHCGFPKAFKKVSRGRVDYVKLRDFISRPRFLELPPLRVQHTPGHLLNAAPQYPACWLHVFAGCKLEEWCAEFPIEGTVQGAFSWAFLKALAKGHFHCGLYQFQQVLVHMLTALKMHFRGVDQTPQLQLSQAASMQDVVLWT